MNEYNRMERIKTTIYDATKPASDKLFVAANNRVGEHDLSESEQDPVVAVKGALT
ncbi:MAG: hypothetical protein NTY50_16875 [Methylobacter sp.]|nr:hypothetical protein [Methylobacter sp.]